MPPILNRSAFDVTLSRRSLLGVAGATVASLVAAPARATGDSSRFTFGILRYGSPAWNPRPNALSRLLREVETTTSIPVAEDPIEVAPTLESLIAAPLVVWSGDRGFAPLDEASRRALQTWLRAGGTLLVDSAEGRDEGEFEASIRRELAAILPDVAVPRIPSEHVLFKSFYLVDGSPGRVGVSPNVYGAEFEGRMAVILSPNDLMGAWARDALGNPQYDVYPGGERQRQMAFRFGVNIVMYALCTDYKDDQVHVPFILRRRRWRVSE